MINAKEANKRTRETVNQMQKKAEQWVDSEWEFVEGKIQEAIANGEFSTSYWWSKEILQEAGIKKSDAASALAEKAYKLGFCQQVYQNWGSCNVLKIDLFWERV